MSSLIYDGTYSIHMVRGKVTQKEIEEQKKEQKLRAGALRASRRSGKSIKKEGKVNKSTAKTRTPRSQKKAATVRKSRY